MASCILLSCGNKKADSAVDANDSLANEKVLAQDSVSKDEQEQSQEKVLSLPVSVEQLAKDWREASKELYVYDESMLNQYLVTDLDSDGNPEVLLFGTDPASPSAILFYKDGKMVNSNCASDGYSTYYIGKGNDGSAWFAEEYDNHAGDYRMWSTCYYKIENCNIVALGEKVISREGVSEEEDEDYEMSEYSDIPKGVEIPELDSYYELKDWKSVKFDFSKLPPRKEN